MEDRAQNPEEEQETAVVFEPNSGLYVRHVEDRGLPATVVLPELSEARRCDGPVPVFVP